MDERTDRVESNGVELLTRDGEFVVLVDGEERVRTRVRALAMIEYKDAVTTRSGAVKRLAAERARSDLNALKGEFFGAAARRPKTGRGGRGGV